MIRPFAGALVVALAGWACSGRAPQGGSPADSILGAGRALYEAEDFDSAHALWSLELERARARRDDSAQALLLTEIALADWRLTNLADARTRQEQALALKLRLGWSGELSRSYNALGLIATSETRNLEAVRLLEWAIETARAAGDGAGMARAAGNLATPVLSLGDFARARAAARQLRAAGRSLENARWEGNGLNNEAMVDLYLGDPASAIGRLDTARSLYQSIGYETGEQVALGQLATAWELTGEYDRSFAALDTALSLSRQLGLREDEAINLRLIADLHHRIGDYRRAVRFYDQADSLFRESGAESELGIVLRGRAQSYLRLGNLTRARQSAQAALVNHRDAGELPQAIDDLILLSEVSLANRDKGPALAYLDSARTLSREYDTRGTRIAVGLATARAAEQAGDFRRMLDGLRRLEPDIAPGDHGAEWEAAALEARARARLNELDEAATSGRRAIDAIERVRSSLPSDALRGTLVTDRADVYADLVLVLLRLGLPEEAFAVADAARSRGLLEQLSAVRGDSALTALPRTLAEGEALLRRIDQLVQRLRETEQRPPRERGEAFDRADAELLGQLASARNEYEALFVRMAEEDPATGALLGTRRLQVPEVREALGPGQTLVEYLLSRDEIVAFVLTRDSLQVLRTPLDVATLTSRVQLLRGLWGSTREDWRLGLPAARALYRSLLEPVLRALASRNTVELFIVPHGILGQIPFAALQSERTGRFLVQDLAISHLPSAGALPTLVGRSGSRRQLLSGAIGFAPFPDDLPASGPEVAAVRAHLPGSETHLQRRASEPALRSALATKRPVHVATHGVLNARNPMFSRIELARTGTWSPGNDGRLEVHEILALRVRSPLVFFSGCETGAGQEWSQDALLGTADLTLAQAALAAGAGAVISTLWRIDDAGAARFAEQFYRGLRRASALSALAQAQRWMAADTDYSNPYYWAGYTLSGAGSAIGAQDQRVASVSPRTGLSLSSRFQRSTP